MVLAFKNQFVSPIMKGTKIHTIREDKTRRWQSGKSIQMATGVRTKNYNCFNQSVCTGTQKVFMTYAYSNIIEISIDGKYMNSFIDRDEFAKNDGFETWDDFFNWFYPLIKNDPDECFSGRIIHWTDFRYE